MQFTIAAIAAFAASASAMALNTTAPASAVYVTEVVTHLTTFCPAATVLTAGSHTITVTAPTTITIEDCSCTLTKTSSVAAVPTAPATSAPYVSAPVYHNGTTATVTSAHGTGAAHSTGASTAKPSQFTGAASSMNVAGAAAAALGMAALIL
ncbi:hypothetical protein KCU99_g2139, partial [Aureobasidium melanogenum]